MICHISLKCEIDAHADDSTITATAPTMESIGQILTENCAVVSQWMWANKLKLIADKTHLLTVGTAERLRNLHNTVDVQMEGFTLSEGLDKFELLLSVQIQANFKRHKPIKFLH